MSGNNLSKEGVPYKDPEMARRCKRKHYLNNRDRILEREGKRYHDNRSRAMEYQMIHKYGITMAQFDEILLRQGGCAICKSPTANRRGHKMHIDHDHATGKVRGLLCAHCNTALGLVKESVATLVAMIKYLNDNK